MFVDFDKVFRKTPQNELKIPKELIDQLSSKLPEGFVYVVDKDSNNLTISHDGKEDLKYTISGITLEPTEAQKAVLGEDYSFEDVLKLSFNSQQPVPVRFKDDKYVNINGTDVPIKNLSFNPFKPHEIILNSAFIFPASFPPAFPVQIGCNTTTLELSVKRIPNNSLSTKAFESDPSKCLTVRYFFEPASNQFSMTLNISLDKATSIKEIIDSIEIMNAFAEGKGILGGTLIERRLELANSTKYDEKVLEFWKKVKTLEDALNVVFRPNVADLDYEDVCAIEEIYQNIIHQTPIRHNTGINSITSKWEFNKDGIAEDTIGTPIYFEFDGSVSFELFSQEIELPCIVGVFNAVFANYEKDEEKEECTIYLENESEEKQMYTSRLMFVTKEELLKYKNETENRILIFRDAKRIKEYLNKEK